MAKDADKKQCFVVGPIGNDDSDDRIHADWLLEDIILPVFSEQYPNFEVSRADKISNPGQINSQVISALLQAELVIADLSTLNPNAFYEIGIRHAIQKPIIHMHIKGQRIPFDIAPFRSIEFSRIRPADIRAARVALVAFVKEATDHDHVVDNPVTFSRGAIQFEQTATPTERLLEEQLSSLKTRIDLLDMQLGNPPSNMITLHGGQANLYVTDSNGNRLTRHRERQPMIALNVERRGGTKVEEYRKFVFEFVEREFRDAVVSNETEGSLSLRIPDTAENREKIMNLQASVSELSFEVDVITS